ncbi:MAG TPA: TldD/PmbA family protein, partial [Gemmatimonadales bacterium]|nr:TldD/PmbA family protein [Gemmatimonadales bacterium]
SARVSRTQGVNLRVVAEGRMGFAGTVGDDASEILENALTSARHGEAASVTLPKPAAEIPRVFTHAPRAATATLHELMALATMVRDRLAAERADLTITVERSIGTVRVANTRGVDAGYDVTLVTLSLEAARVREGRRLVTGGRISGVDLPSLGEIEALVTRVRQRLGWAEREAKASAGRQQVGFLPTAVPLLLHPLEQALLGKTVIQGSSPLGRRKGAKVYSELFTLSDNPLLDGRPGSRPVDDEGVVSRAVPLVQAGRVEGFLYDLETATRVGVPPTGHGRRTTFAKPQPACTNLIVEPGAASFEELLQAVGDGILLEETRGGQVGNAAGGTFAHTAALAWKVEGGEVTGLAQELTVAGNAHDLLGRVTAVGADPLWIGPRSMPALVVEGVSVF